MTVFANPAAGECRELIGGRAVHSTEPGRVVIAAFGIDRRADDCMQSGRAAPAGSAAERVVVGGRAAVLSTKSYAWTLSWRAEGIDVELRFGAAEGVTLARGYVLQLIDELGW